MSSSRIIILLYFFIVAGCVSASTWSTYFGYARLLGLLALPVSLVIGACLVLCDVTIFKYRREGKSFFSFLGVVFFLLFLTAISWAANFNFFYTNFMRDRLVTLTTTAASDRFDQNMRLAEVAVQRNGTTSKLEQDINQLLRRLGDEVRDPRARGFGTKAKAVVEEIYARLAPIRVQPAKLPPEGAPFEENERTLAEIRRRVTEAIKGASDPLAAARGAIEEAKGRQAASAQSLADLERTTNAGALTFVRIEAIAKWAAETRLVERTINQALTAANKTEKLDLPPISADELELDRIPSSIKSGFYDQPDPKSTAVAAALAVVIDVLPLVVAIFVTAAVPVGGVPGPRPEPVGPLKQLRVIGGRRSLGGEVPTSAKISSSSKRFQGYFVTAQVGRAPLWSLRR